MLVGWADGNDEVAVLADRRHRPDRAASPSTDDRPDGEIQLLVLSALARTMARADLGDQLGLNLGSQLNFADARQLLAARSSRRRVPSSRPLASATSNMHQEPT